MISIYLYSFLSVFFVSLISFIGVFTLSLKDELVKKYMFIFISVAVGALLGDAFIHLIPEALESATNPLITSLLIISGVFFFFILEKFLHWHHHGEDTDDDYVHPVGKLVLFSDGVHNFIDGVVMAISFLVSIPVGVATTIAVVLHEIPQEIGDFAVLVHSGYSKGKALWFNFLSALPAVLGMILVFSLGSMVENASHWLVPLGAGGFIYIAVADLIPELHKTKELKHSLIQVFSVAIGVFAMVALVFVE